MATVFLKTLWLFRRIMRLKLSVALLSLVVSLVTARAQQDQAISNACSQLMLAKRGEYTLSVPTENSSVSVRIVESSPSDRLKYAKKRDGTWEAGYDVGQTLVPMVLRAGFVSNTKGDVVLRFSVPVNGQNRSWQFSSAGLTEALYAARCLDPERKLEEAIAAHIPASTVVVPLSPEKHREILSRSSETNIDVTTRLTLLRVVEDSFNAHRAEMLSRFGKSYLFYPPADKLRWSIRGVGSEVYAITGCSDRMYWATFVVELNRNDGENWSLSRIYANESFKGEK